MKRSMRLAAIAVGVLGLVATAAPQPAQARTAGTAVFVATATVGTAAGEGLGYPVLTLTVDTNVLTTGGPLATIAHLFDGSHPASNCLTLQDLNDPACLTNSHWTFDHVRSLQVAHIVCAGASVNVNKGPKPPVNAGACAFTTVATPTLPNTVSGHCGLSSGQLTVSFTEAGNPTSFLLDLHFKAIGGKVVLTGHWRKGTQHGLVVAVGVAIPPLPVIGGGQTCLNKSARNFLVPGVAVVIPSTTL